MFFSGINETGAYKPFLYTGIFILFENKDFTKRCEAGESRHKQNSAKSIGVQDAKNRSEV